MVLAVDHSPDEGRIGIRFRWCPGWAGAAAAWAGELGEVGLIGSPIGGAGQLHHRSCLGVGDGVAGPTAAVPVGQCVGALLAIGRQQAPGQDAFLAPYPHWGGKWATRPRNPPVLPTVGLGRRCQRLGLPQPQAAPSRNWATWGPRRQDGLGVASHQERCAAGCPGRARKSAPAAHRRDFRRVVAPRWSSPVCLCRQSPSGGLSGSSGQGGRRSHFPSPTTRFSYHTNRRRSIRCHKVVAVPPQGSKGRPAHAVSSSKS